jgi:hypothetical protein
MADNGQSSSSKVEEFSSKSTDDDLDLKYLTLEELEYAVAEIQYKRRVV